MWFAPESANHEGQRVLTLTLQIKDLPIPRPVKSVPSASNSSRRSPIASKIRLFKLAHDLNVGSQDLLLAAAKIGIVIKNSALASVTPEERDAIIECLNGDTRAKTYSWSPGSMPGMSGDSKHLN